MLVGLQVYIVSDLEVSMELLEEVEYMGNSDLAAMRDFGI